jgi:DNA-binding transcriptional MerR regulator
VTDELLHIGEVARRSGLRPSALRFYEESGLLRPAARVGGRRRYEPSVLQRLAVIRLLADAGFTIQEMAALLRGGAGRRRWRPLAERKLRDVEARFAEIQEASRLLQLALACGCESLEGCAAVSARYGIHRGDARPEPKATRRPHIDRLGR